MTVIDALRRLWHWPVSVPIMEPVTGHVADLADDLQVDGEGWLVGPGVERVPSVRHSPLTAREPFAILWHFTATRPGTARSLAKRIRTYRKRIDRAASWHVIVAQDGKLWQSVPFLRGAWHCARGTIRSQYWSGHTRFWDSDVDNVAHRINSCAIGIELEALDGQSFPWQQVDAATRLVRALVDAYPIYPTNAGLSHSMFDPARRTDPGPVWEAMLPKILRAAYGAELP